MPIYSSIEQLRYVFHTFIIYVMKGSSVGLQLINLLVCCCAKLSDTKRDWDNIFCGSTNSVCNLLQVYEEANSSKECKRGESLRGGSW